jgi:hypothetical protein
LLLLLDELPRFSSDAANLASREVIDFFFFFLSSPSFSAAAYVIGADCREKPPPPPCMFGWCSGFGSSNAAVSLGMPSDTREGPTPLPAPP